MQELDPDSLSLPHCYQVSYMTRDPNNWRRSRSGNLMRFRGSILHEGLGAMPPTGLRDSVSLWAMSL